MSAAQSSASSVPEPGRAPRPVAFGVAVAALALLGAVAASVARGYAPPPPAGAGADRLASPEVLLAVFDTAWVLLLLPGRAAWDRVALAAVGLPFHVALAASASAGEGHAAAWALFLAAYALAASVRRRGSRLPGLALALVTCGAPLVGYALMEFVQVDAVALVAASPLTGPTLLARAATSVGAASGVAGVAGAAAVLVLDQLFARIPGREPDA
jgi:hypothetical protein